MRRLLMTLATLATLCAVLPAVPSTAAEASSGLPVKVQIWPEAEPTQMLIIVSADLPADAKLPTTITLPLPDGAELLWAGEVVGTDPGQDIQRSPEMVDGKGGKAVRIELQSARSAQYEATIGTMTVSGLKSSGKLRWVQSVDAPTTSFSVRLPANVVDAKIRPTPASLPQRNNQGESLFTLPDRALKPGEEVTVDVEYARGEAATNLVAGDGGSGVDRSTLILVIGGIALVLGAAAVIVQRKASARRAE